MVKRVLCGLFFVATLAHGQQPSSGVRHDYLCQKGDKKIKYRVSYKEVDRRPPCKVYELYAGKKTKKIAESMQTTSVCDVAIERIIRKLETEGMDCAEVKP